LMMSATLKRHRIESVDLDQNYGCGQPFKGYDGLPSCIPTASGCLRFCGRG
jgi:hypothetical protein